jgi:chemotaxis protein methyltransferase CheR
MSPQTVLPLSESEFHLFRDYIHKKSGIYLDDYKSDSLRDALLALMRQKDIGGYAEYMHLLKDPAEGEREFKRLLDLVTVNETCFFRNPAQFEALRKVVLPEIIKTKECSGNRTIKIWSAGCSTGEEPYSIAMTLLEYLPEPENWRIDILATDVSSQVLTDAQKGVYGKRTLRETDNYYLRKYFSDSGDGHYALSQKVKNMVTFNYHNLVAESYPMLVLGGWDIIFCRNVTIYFQLDSVRKVIEDFYTALRDGGFLFIGHAESLYKVNEKFVPMHIGGAYVYKKDEAAPAICLIESTDFRKAAGPDRREEKPIIRQEFRRDADKAALYATAYEHFVKEEFDDAAKLAQKLVKIEPSNIEARVLLANIYVNQNRLDNALRQVSAALELNSISAKAHYLLGMIREKQGQLDEAVREFKQVLYIDRDFAIAHINLANIYKMRNLAAEAAKEYNNAIAALAVSPRGDWADFAGGFLGDVLAEICRRNLAGLG